MYMGFVQNLRGAIRPFTSILKDETITGDDFPLFQRLLKEETQPADFQKLIKIIM